MTQLLARTRAPHILTVARPHRPADVPAPRADTAVAAEAAPVVERVAVDRSGRTTVEPPSAAARLHGVEPGSAAVRPHGVEPASAGARSHGVEVGFAGARPHGVEVVVAGAALDDAALLRSAAAADTVRIRYAPTLMTTTAVDVLVAVLEGHLLAAGRRRTDVRVVLEVETVVADDEADAARRRANLSYAEAFSGLAWRPSSTWLVGTPDQVLADAAALAGATGVDAVVLALVGRSREYADRLRTSAATAA